VEQQVLVNEKGDCSMATATPVYEDRRMSVGRVFHRAFSAIALNPAVILGLALVVGALPGLIFSVAFVKLGLTAQSALQAGTLSFRALMSAMFLSSLIMFVVSALVQGALTRAAVSAAEGTRASFGESLSAALPVLLPLIGLSVLTAIGIAIGFMLLIVPGIMLMMAWSVAVPSLVVERQGVFAAFRRSAELTKGSRWKIFGLSLVLFVIYWLMSAVVGLVGLRGYSAASPEGLTAANLIGGVLVGTVFNAIWGTVQPSLYVELREAKEGDSIESLAQVFA
jgi:uncharacterized membrane protein